MGDAAVKSDERTPEGLLPTGALFEAAFKRFGARMPIYLLYSVVASVPVALAIWAEQAGGIDGPAAFALLGYAFGLGLFLLCGHLASLMTPQPAAQRASVLTAAVAMAAVVAALSAVFPPLVLSVLWAIALVPFAAGSGDHRGLAAITQGIALALRYFPRCIAVQLGLMLVAAGFWLGLGIAIAQFVRGDALEISRASLTILFTWPISALVLRNLYGDLTGRQILRGPIYTDPEKRRK